MLFQLSYSPGCDFRLSKPLKPVKPPRNKFPRLCLEERHGLSLPLRPSRGILGESPGRAGPACSRYPCQALNKKSTKAIKGAKRQNTCIIISLLLLTAEYADRLLGRLLLLKVSIRSSLARG